MSHQPLRPVTYSVKFPINQHHFSCFWCRRFLEILSGPHPLSAGTFYTGEILAPCWSRQKSTVNQLQGSHNSIVCLTNTVRHMRRCHSAVWAHQSHHKLSRPDGPWIGRVRGQFSCHPNFHSITLLFLLDMPPIHTSLLQTRVWLPLCGPSSSRRLC